jgi:hypothetical protein
LGHIKPTSPETPLDRPVDNFVAAKIAPAKFEFSDGTVSSSQDACLVAMARARLPPSGTIERTPAAPSGTAH